MSVGAIPGELVKDVFREALNALIVIRLMGHEKIIDNEGVDTAPNVSAERGSSSCRVALVTPREKSASALIVLA